MTERLSDALGRRWAWRRPLVRHLLARYPVAPAREELIGAIAADEALRKAISNQTRPQIVHWVPSLSVMQPNFTDWELPRIDTASGLAARLGISVGELCRLADCEQRQVRADECVRALYRSYWMSKPTGGYRLVEVPCNALKRVQRSLLHEVLGRVPSHPAASAFVAGRSIIDYATPLLGKDVVLHFDLKNFFASIPSSRVHAMFATLG